MLTGFVEVAGSAVADHTCAVDAAGLGVYLISFANFKSDCGCVVCLCRCNDVLG